MRCAELWALLLIVVLLACEIREVALRVHQCPGPAIKRRLLLLLLRLMLLCPLLLVDVCAMLVWVESVVAGHHGARSCATVVGTRG
jgi:hypothetical protein